MDSPLYLALIHHPVLNKRGNVVTTSVTNFDLHDLARTGRTYGVNRVFIVTPNPSQREMVRFIGGYWREGFGSVSNPDRKEAMELIEDVADTEEARLTIKNRDGTWPYVVATSARPCNIALKISDLPAGGAGEGRPLLLCFGTGHGLTGDFIKGCDAVLAPITGPGDYNHLPVRAAVAIYLDRLRGKSPRGQKSG